ANGASQRARLVARADRLVREPVALLAIAAAPEVERTAAEIWMRVEMPADLDDGKLDIPIEIEAEHRLYASPALGWPPARGTERAATGALAMGEDRPFQDVGLLEDADPPNPDVTFYGSGLSGRTASLALPARADTGERPAPSSEAPPIDTRWPA